MLSHSHSITHTIIIVKYLINRNGREFETKIVLSFQLRIDKGAIDFKATAISMLLVDNLEKR